MYCLSQVLSPLKILLHAGFPTCTVSFPPSSLGFDPTTRIELEYDILSIVRFETDNVKNALPRQYTKLVHSFQPVLRPPLAVLVEDVMVRLGMHRVASGRVCRVPYMAWQKFWLPESCLALRGAIHSTSSSSSKLQVSCIASSSRKKSH